MRRPTVPRDPPPADDTAIPCVRCDERPKLWQDELGWNCCCFCYYSLRGSLNARSPEHAIQLWNELNAESSPRRPHRPHSPAGPQE